MFSLLLACSGPVISDAELLASALDLIESEPTAALELCLEIDSNAVKIGCVEQAAPAIAMDDPATGLSACERLTNMDECIFKVAEETNDVGLCERAGEFTFNCKMHIFSRSLHSWISNEASPSEISLIARSHIEASTLSPDDPRPWSAIWRWVLGAQRPLNRASCAEIGQAMEREACEMTSIAVFNDRLNHHRDLGANLCEGELPESIQYVSDPHLDRTLNNRRREDLCDVTAVLAPPIGALPGEGR
jgi:hypothetical protein